MRVDRTIKFLCRLVVVMIGLFLISDSFSITGFAISEAKGPGSSIFGIIGFILLLIGVVMLGKENYREGNMGFRSRDSLQRHNRIATIVAQRQYIFEHHGKKPNDKELREYVRHLHETGELHELVENYNERRKK